MYVNRAYWVSGVYHFLLHVYTGLDWWVKEHYRYKAGRSWGFKFQLLLYK